MPEMGIKIQIVLSQMVQHAFHTAKVKGSGILMHCKSLWIKVPAK